MILRAKFVLPMVQPPIEDGAVVVEGDTVLAVGPAKDIQTGYGGEVRDLGEVVLLPGLINAHCHLDYTDMVHEVEWRGSFIEWILQLVALKQLRSDKQYLAAIQSGMTQLLKSGTTSVVNIECFPPLIDQLPPAQLRIWWCMELIDFNRPDPAKDIAQQALEVIAARQNILGGFGLAPHAPYTVSGDLYRLAGQHTRARNILLTTHLAESEQEDDMFRHGTGPMYDYFLRAGRDMSDCRRVGPVQLLSELTVLAPNCLAAHANYLTPLDVTLLKQSGAHVVHCPKSYRFFNRPTPLLSVFWQNDINVCLGTDSLVSNDTLDMFAEMQTLTREFPRVSAEKVLSMATVCGAKALNLSDKLGKIAADAWADLIAVPLDGARVDPYEAVVYAETPVCFSMIGGKVVHDAEV
ncbi:MAG: amidohydrolase family protein [Verrucomicrobiia bacterium]